MNFKQRSRSGFKEKSSDLRKVITVSGCMFLLLTVEGSNLWANSFMNPSQQVIKLSSKMQDVTVPEVLASVLGEYPTKTSPISNIIFFIILRIILCK